MRLIPRLLATSCAVIALFGCDSSSTLSTAPSNPTPSTQLYARLGGMVVPVHRDEQGIIHWVSSIIVPESLLVDAPANFAAGRTQGGVVQGGSILAPNGQLAAQWPDGVIPYVIRGGSDATFQQDVLAAIKAWAGTGVTFVPATAAQITANANRLEFVADDPLYSCYMVSWGMLGGAQKIFAKSGCRTDDPGFLKRNIGFALGLLPLVSLPDRDNFLKVDKVQYDLYIKNCMNGDSWQFTPAKALLYGTNDLQSVMNEGTVARCFQSSATGSGGLAYNLFYTPSGGFMPPSSTLTPQDLALGRALLQKKPTYSYLPSTSGNTFTGVGHFLSRTSSDIYVVTPWKITVYPSGTTTSAAAITTDFSSKAPASWLNLAWSTKDFRIIKGDNNGDGIEDLQILASPGQSLLFLGLGDGRFSVEIPWGDAAIMGWWGLDGASADFEGKGLTGTASWGNRSISVFLSSTRNPWPTRYVGMSTGSGQFSLSSLFGTVDLLGNKVRSVILADGSNLYYNLPSLDGTGSYSSSQTLSMLTLPTSVTGWSGPFTGNFGTGPDRDFIYVSPQGQTVTCNGGSTPTCKLGQLPGSNVLSGIQPKWGSGDINIDGSADLYALTSNATFVWTNNQRGTGWIQSQMNNPAPIGNLYDVTPYAADFNQNGITDFLFMRKANIGVTERGFLFKR